MFCYLLYDLGCWHVLFLSLFFVGFWVIMLDMCLLVGIYVSKIFVMGWLQMLQNSLEQCNMSLLIVCIEIMQISSLGSKLQKFVLLFVLLFLFLGYNYQKKIKNKIKNKKWGFWVLIPYFVVICLQLKLFATISWVQSDIIFMGFPWFVLSFSI